MIKGDFLMKRCMELQCEEMKKHRWIESEKVGHDLGPEMYLDWTKKYAKIFRNWFQQTYGELDG